jgi:hypothetical protein
MSTFNRRTFLDRSAHTGLGLAAGATILANAQSVWAAPANNKVTLGIIGAGGRGGALCDGFLGRGDCHIAWVADADVHFCRVYDQKEWPNFPAAADSNPPQGFDWDLYNSPAPEAKYNANLRGNWHHFWRYSGGDKV